MGKWRSSCVPFGLAALLAAATACSSSERSIADLSSGQPARQIRAAARLVKSPDAKTIPALTAAMRSEDADVRAACSRAIAQTGDRGAIERAATVMAQDAMGPVPDVAIRAVNILGELGQPALPELMTVATVVTEEPLRKASESGLDRLLVPEEVSPTDRDRAMEVLLAALEETDRTLYDASFATLRFVTPLMTESLIEHGLSYPNPFVRRAIAIALSSQATVPVAKALAASLNDPDSDVRTAAAEALGVIRNPGAKEYLQRAAETDIDLGVRRAAQSALDALP